ncbi:DUF3237 family protein [Sunxiuqinia indica]|uniref:DUF3237 family protein n=1 Tax=Sunxiuqinia indica TaxID=2692584 RepID=UPI001358EDB3|nr:DUF3237 family protein [Sunxiuqinia indica]
MKRVRSVLIFCLVIGFNLTLSAQEYVAPGLEFTCELKVTIDPVMNLGSTCYGDRIIIPISGGTFEGPKLKGTVLPGGADYQKLYKDNGLTELEAIYTIRTDDNVLIHVRNVGIFYNPNEDAVKTTADSNEIYFRTAPKFEAPEDSKYAWLNHAIFICKPVPAKDYISIQVWKVL